MGAAGMTLLEDSRQVRTALSPLRRQLLAMLQEPASASELGGRLGYLGRRSTTTSDCWSGRG